MSKSLNAGILTARPKIRLKAKRRALREPQVSLYKAAIVTLGLCAMAFSYGHSLSDPAPRTRLFPIIEHVIKHVPTPYCAPLAKRLKQKKYYGEQRDRLAAAIPASALQPYPKGR